MLPVWMNRKLVGSWWEADERTSNDYLLHVSAVKHSNSERAVGEGHHFGNNITTLGNAKLEQMRTFCAYLSNHVCIKVWGKCNH